MADKDMVYRTLIIYGGWDYFASFSRLIAEAIKNLVSDICDIDISDDPDRYDELCQELEKEIIGLIVELTSKIYTDEDIDALVASSCAQAKDPKLEKKTAIISHLLDQRCKRIIKERVMGIGSQLMAFECG